MAIGDVFSVAVKGVQGTKPWANVLHFVRKTAGPGDFNLMNNVETNYAASWLPVCGPTLELTSVVATRLVIPLGEQYSASYSAFGSGSSPLGAVQTALCTTLRTTLAGRSHRGRVYLPGLQGASVTTGAINSTSLTAANALWSSMLTEFGPSGTDANWQWIVFSRKLGSTVILNPTPPPRHITTAYNVAAGTFPVVSFLTRPDSKQIRRRQLSKD